MSFPGFQKRRQVPADKIRIDKWLWSVRIFKSRSQATDACRSGNVKINDKKVKPSFIVEPGHTIFVKKNGFNMQYLVEQLISKRVSATLAEACYKNLTPEEELNKYKDWFIGKAKAEVRQRGEGRPTKRQRREIDQFKEHIYDED